jgi:hypothetical protein
LIIQVRLKQYKNDEIISWDCYEFGHALSCS